MADNNDLFNEEEQMGGQQEGSNPSGAEALAGTGDQAGDIVSKWVGEGKKFSSVDELVKSYDNSQQFIDQLKQENADMRRELTNAEKLDHILDRIEASGSQERSPQGEGAPKETPSDGAGSNDANNIEEQISKAVQNEVTRREKQRTAEQNQNRASDELLELAGNDRNEAKRILKKTADDLGVSVGYLQEQAQVSPSAFKRMVSASKEDASGNSGGLGDSGRTSASQNTEAFEANSFRSGTGDVQPWSYWQKKKREMSKAEFYSPTVQNRIFKSRQELGDRFFDTSS